MRSLKYVIARRWLRAHATLVVAVVVAFVIVVYLLTR